MKLTLVATLILLFAPVSFPQTKLPSASCQNLALQGATTSIEAHPQKGEKFRRPPMVAYEVLEDGDVRKVRLVRHSGVKELDGKLLATASQWEYQPRPRCSTVKVRLAAGLIPDEAAALRVAEPELIRIYGTSVIALERPLIASSSGDMWIVGGTLLSGNGGASTVCAGGVATVHPSKSDGRVMQIFHTK